MAATAQATRPEPHGSRTMTVTPTTDTEAGPSTATASPPESRESSVGVLRLRGGPVRRQRVEWAAETIDNEGMGKKKSKSELPQRVTCHAITAQIKRRHAQVRAMLTKLQSAAFTTSPGALTNHRLNLNPRTATTTMTAVRMTRTTMALLSVHATVAASAARWKRTAAPSQTAAAVMAARGA